MTKNGVKASEALNKQLDKKTNGALVVSKQGLQQAAKASGMAPGRRIDALIKAQMRGIKQAIGQTIDPESFARTALTVIKQTPALMECSEISLLGGLMQAAQVKLTLGPLLGQAYLVPRWNNKLGCKEASFQIGYKGLLKLAYQSGVIQAVLANEVRENDEFDFEFGLDHKLKHKPAMNNRGNITHFYAYAIFKDGGNMFTVMTVDDVNTIRDKHSDAKKSSFSPWNDKAIGYAEMGKKTVLRRLCKNLPLSTEVMDMVSRDETTRRVSNDVDETELSFDVDVTPEPLESEPEVDPNTGEVLPESVLNDKK